MSLTVSESERGVAYWLDETTFERDFHNVFYEQMAAANPLGDFNDAWWQPFLRVLNQWQATRNCAGRTFLTQRAQVRFAQLSLIWNLE